MPESLLDRTHYGDVREFPPELLDGVDVVVHLAAISNDPMGKEFEGVTEAINGEPATPSNGGTIGFKCDSPEQVKQFHDVAVASGGTTCEDPPGLRQGSMGALHLAYVRDPDGNKLCAVHRPA